MSRLSARNYYSFCLRVVLLVGIALPFNAFAQSGPTTLNISGGLFNPNGTPVTNSSVSFKIEIRDKAGTCILYSESHSGVDLSASKGGFALKIGEGSAKTNNIDAGFPTALSTKVFANPGAVAPFPGCAGGLTLASGDERLIRVYYDLGSGFTAMSPDVPITSAAYAMVAETLEGKHAADFVQVRDDATYDLNQANVESIFSAANFAKLTAILSGDASNQRLTNVVDPTAASDAATKGYADANVGGKIVDVSGVGPAAGNGQTLIWDQAQNKWVTGVPSAIDASKLPLAGGTMTGAIDMGANNIVNIGHMTMAAQRTLNLGTYTDAQETTLVAGLGAADKGKVWFNTTSNTFKVWDGSAAVNSFAPSGAAGGDLTGTYPNPTIAANAVIASKINTDAVTTAKINKANAVAGGTLMMVDTIDTSRVEYKSCAVGEALMWTAGGWACTNVAGFLGTSGVTAATYGSATQVGQFAVDAQGRITSASNVAITFPVTSVAGKTGAVTLNTADITNAGTAATKDFGTAAGELVELDGTGKIPVGLMPTSMGDIQDVVAGSGLTGGGSSGAVTLSVDTGITTGKIVQMAASDKLPAVDGSNLTNINAVKIQARDVAATAPGANEVLMWNNGTSVWEPKAIPSAPVLSVASKTGAVVLDWSDILNAAGKYFGYRPNNVACADGEVLKWNNSASYWQCGTDIGGAGFVTHVGSGTGLTGGPITSTGTLSVDVGVTTGKIIQVAASNKLPVIDGSNLTNINAVQLQARDVSATAPTANQVLKWNNGTSAWEPAADTDTTTTIVAGTGLTGGVITTNGTVAVDVGVTAGKIIQVAASDKLPVIDGSNLTQINAVKLQTRDVASAAPNDNEVLTWNNAAARWEARALPAGNIGDITSVVNGTGLTGGGTSGDVTLNIDVGVTTGKIIQVAASNKLPVIDGSNLTNINAVQLQARDVSSTAPTANQVLKWNNSTSVWEPAAETDAFTGTVTSVVGGTGLTGGNITSTGTLAVDVGTTTGKIVQMAASNKLPAVDGSNLTNLNVSGSNGFVQNGNSFGAAATLGTNDNFALNLEANGATAMTILPSGNVGVGTATPGYLLHVSSSADALTGTRVNNSSTGTSAISMSSVTSDDAGLVFESYGSTNAGTLAGMAAADAVAVRSQTAPAPSKMFIGTSTAIPLYLMTGAAVRMTVDSSGDVGIGSTSPTSKLNIVSGANADLNIDSYSATANGSVIRLRSARGTSAAPTASQLNDRLGLFGGYGYGTTAFSGSTRGGLGVYAAQAFTDAAQGTYVTLETTSIGTNVTQERLRITDSGNVGIGTTNPASKLDVIGTITATGFSGPVSTSVGTFGLGTVGAPSITFTGDTNTGWWSPAADTLAASTAGAERVRIDSSGNVGVGTNAPTSKFEVFGNIKSFNNSNAVIRSDAYGTGFTGHFIGSMARGTAAAPTYPQTGDALAAFQGRDSIDWTAFGGMAVFAEENFAVGAKGINLRFTTTPIGTNAPSERMRITASGNVGIGSTVPVSKLDVNGTVTATGFAGPITSSVVSAGAGTAGAPSLSFSGDPNTGFYNASSNDTISVAINSAKTFDFNSTGLISPTAGGALITTGNGTAGAPTFSFAGDTDTGWWRPAADTMAASTAGAERMRIGSTGNVGIGTTNPSNLLEIVKDQSANSAIIVRNHDAGTAAIAQFMAFNAAGAAGSFGIGGTGYTSIPILQDRAFIDANASTSGIAVNTETAQPIVFGTSNTERARIDSGGNVGIGTTVPSEKLEVTGSIYSNPSPYNSGNLYGADSTGTKRQLVGVSNIQANATVLQSAGGGIALRNSAITPHFFMTESGNVGIGTTSPETKLHLSQSDVSAGLVVENINSTASRWPSVTVRNFRGSPDTSGYPVYHLEANRGTSGAQTALQSGDSLGMLQFWGAKDASTRARGAQIGAVAAENFSGASAATDMIFLTAPTGQSDSTGYERVRIKSTGNVGIGTASPASKLTVSGGAIRIMGSDPTPLLVVGSEVETGTPVADYFRMHYDLNALGASQDAIVFDKTDGNSADPDGGIAFSNTGNDGVRDISMVIRGNGRVGIGTTNPGTELHVIGTVTATSFSGGPMSSSVVSAGAGTVGAPSLTFSGDPNTGFYNASSNDTISVATGGTNIFNFSSAGLVSPTAGGGLVTTGNGTTGAPTFSFSGDPDTGWWRPAADTMAASTGGVERMRISSTGNIGIGTAAPVYPLHLLDTSTATSGNAILSYNFYHAAPAAASTASYYGGFNVVDSAGSGANNIAALANYNLARHDGTGTVTTIRGAYNYAQNNNTGTVTNLYAADNTAQNATTGTVSNMRGATNSATQSGASPSTIANAYGTYSIVSNTGTGTITNGYAFMVDINNTGGGALTNGYGLYIQDITATNDYGIYQVNSTDDNYFAGNVGIGTANPTGKLNVNGNVYVDNIAFGGTPAISLAVGDTDTGLNNTTDGQLDIYSNNVKSISVRNSSVGIGTTTPSTRLHVFGGDTTLGGNVGVMDAAPNASYAINSSFTVDGNANRVGLSNYVTLDSTAALTAARTSYGAINDVSSNATDGNVGPNTLVLWGAYNRARGSTTAATAGAATSLGGAYNHGLSQSSSTTALSSVYGANNLAQNISATSNITNMYGSYNSVLQNDAGASTTTAFATRSAITNTAGAMTTGYLFYGAYSGTIGTKWGAYLTGEDKNYFSGDVGIGTATPTQKLHVVGNIIATGSIDAGTQFLGLATDTAAAPSFSWTGDTNTGMYRSAADVIDFATGGVNRVTINSAGLSSVGDVFANGTKYEGDGKEIIRYSDTWLRLNPANEFTSGIYAGTGIFRTDGDLQVGGSGAAMLMDAGTHTLTIGNGTVAADIDLKSNATNNPAIRFFDAGTERGSLRYSNSQAAMIIRAYNGGAADRIRMPNGANSIQGDGNFQDAAFGPSEWAIGSGKQGDVVCFSGSRIDDDGERRVIVEPCKEANSSRAVGVIIPDDEEAHHGNPNFEYQDKMRAKYGFKDNEFVDLFWRKNHVGVELTGYRPVNAIGPVKVGDPLVSSDLPGFAMASATPGPSAHFATAVQDLAAGEKGTVLARVHLRSGLPMSLYALDELARSETPQDSHFVRTFFVNLQSRLAKWLSDSKNGISEIFAKKVVTDELCVEDVCVDKATFLKMVQEAQKKESKPSQPENPRTPASLPSTSNRDK